MALLSDLVRRLGEALLSAVASPNAAQGFSAAHSGALAKLISGLPVGAIVDLIQGRATVDSDLELAESAAALVGAAFPPGALTASEVAFALEALQFLLDAAGLGGKPFQIEGGIPAAFPSGGGPGPYRGR